jgi:hypothetical protein
VSAEWVGWGSAIVLFATIVRQVQMQWRAGPGSGVSSWLFIGQLIASLGFAWYSFLVGNAVFVVTNMLLAITALIGQWVHWRQA